MSIFVIPMAGLSSRFFKAGYELPKYQLPLEQGTMFSWSLTSFKNYFKTDDFLFIVRDIYDTPTFVKSQCEKMGIENYKICVLNKETSGQAETVFLGLEYIKSSSEKSFSNDSIIIFNIDSKRVDYLKPEWIDDCDGYLELFKAEGEHWSFAKLDSQYNVLETVEKERISEFASNGLYCFSSIELFKLAYKDSVDNNKLVAGELYVAPLYNYLIEKGYSIKGEVISSELTKVAGTPDEYILLQKGGVK